MLLDAHREPVQRRAQGHRRLGERSAAAEVAIDVEADGANGHGHKDLRPCCVSGAGAQARCIIDVRRGLHRHGDLDCLDYRIVHDVPEQGRERAPHAEALAQAVLF
jgi:hypothetical protein